MVLALLFELRAEILPLIFPICGKQGRNKVEEEKVFLETF